MKTRTRRDNLNRALLSLGAAVLLGIPGCGGGGNDVTPCTDLVFSSALATPADRDVFLQKITSDCKTVDVGVYVHNLSGVFTVGFDLTYPSGLLSYQTYFKGPLLQSGSPAKPPVFFVVNPSAGVLQVTMTRFAPDADASASGSVQLITLRFNKTAAGGGTIDFDTGGSSAVTEEILDSTGSTRPASFGPGHGGTVVAP